MNELPDTADALQAKETANKVPLGWWAFYFGLIIWGVYYVYAYSPSLGGWSQAKDYEESVKAAASATAVAAETSQNITATIFFTAIATVVAIFLAVGAARRKKG